MMLLALKLLLVPTLIALVTLAGHRWPNRLIQSIPVGPGSPKPAPENSSQGAIDASPTQMSRCCGVRSLRTSMVRRRSYVA